MKKLKKHSMYEIKWIDTYGYNGWYSEEEIDNKTSENGAVTSIGFCIKETPDYIIICMTMDERTDDFTPYGCPKWIPKGFIKSIKELKFV